MPENDQINVRDEIIALLDSIKTPYRIQAGIITVTPTEGPKWSFTLPQPLDDDGKVLGTDQAVHIGQEREWLSTGVKFKVEGLVENDKYHIGNPEVFFTEFLMRNSSRVL